MRRASGASTRAGAKGRPAAMACSSSTRPQPGQQTKPRGRGRGQDLPAKPDFGGKAAEQAAQVFRAPGPEVGVAVRRQGGGRREGVEAEIWPVVAGQNHEGHPVRAGGGARALDAVAPVIEAAETPDHDDPRPRDHRLHVEVHRHRVAQARELGEPQARRAGCVARIGRRRIQSGMSLRHAEQVGIGERQEDDVARSLSEIDRRLALVEGDRVDADQVHGPVRARVMSRDRAEWRRRFQRDDSAFRSPIHVRPIIARRAPVARGPVIRPGRRRPHAGRSPSGRSPRGGRRGVRCPSRGGRNGD